MRRNGPRLSYANVAATLALFMAFSTGTVYAVNEWTGANIVNDSLTGLDIKESTLAKVPDADKLDGMDSRRFVQGGTAVAGVWNTSVGRTYFNRVHTLQDGSESTILRVPNLLHLMTSCGTRDGNPEPIVVLVSDTAGLEVFYQHGIKPVAHVSIPAGDKLAGAMDPIDRLTIQAGTGADSQSGQRLVSITVFVGTGIGQCMTQFSALYQAN